LFQHFDAAPGAQMTDTALASAAENHESLLGTWRRFGDLGPVYEIIAMAPAKPDGTPMMRIRVLESGEELDHNLAYVLADPREA